ncbi:hypothetical protein PROFUN_09940 [Planoprotostelium fungivorum]|uniref:Uncharacterized protein n=1 Tax=Planoprotostelium fungivorum TaxID=1890364 RepID=A0A2P6NGB9_9EUKA|nr:hypothetical protein PROFUN_09940 [Planoprotostelium fungivorum]
MVQRAVVEDDQSRLEMDERNNSGCAPCPHSDTSSDGPQNGRISTISPANDLLEEIPLFAAVAVDASLSIKSSRSPSSLVAVSPVLSSFATTDLSHRARTWPPLGVTQK